LAVTDRTCWNCGISVCCSVQQQLHLGNGIWSSDTVQSYSCSCWYGGYVADWEAEEWRWDSRRR
jgi:hypothetical protein